MEKKLADLLNSAVRKYFKLKINAATEKNAANTVAVLKGPDDLFVRKALVGQGEILEEDIKNHTYILAINVGKMFVKEALLVTIRDESKVAIAAYAKEGLIRQGIAQKAIDQVVDRLK